MKTYTFICYDKYPETRKKYHIFKKRFSSLADVAKFIMTSNKIWLHDKLSRNESAILAMKLRSLIKMKV